MAVGRYEAVMTLNPLAIVAWIVVGLIAGVLAWKFMQRGGNGLGEDLLVGLIGAVVGGLLRSLLLPGTHAGPIGSVVVAFIGAVVLIALVRALPGRSPWR
jgi:uncharacterized membrane protein YeaQ/YmgE (transglycosylase-associated protein family)